MRSRKRIRLIRNRLERAAAKYQSVSGQLALMRALFGSELAKANTLQTLAFVQVTLGQTLYHSPAVTEHDGAALADAAVLEATHASFDQL